MINLRRKEREITNYIILENIIEKATICRLGLCNNNIPYVVPMNYGYNDNCLYFHSAKEGRKIDYIRSNPNVCFEIDIDSSLIKGSNACDWTMKYTSIIGSGIAELVEDPNEKIQGLQYIMKHYSGMENFEFPDRAVQALTIIKVTIESISGKQNA